VPLLAACLGTMLLGAVLVALRRKPTLLPGATVLVVIAVLAGLAAVSWFRSGEAGWETAGWVVLVALAVTGRQRCFLFSASCGQARGAVESSLSMLLLPFEKTVAGYRLTFPDGRAYVDLRQTSWRTVILTFRGNWRSRKARLLRALLGKRFQPVFPRLKVDLR
jgi:hypothetical protein